MDRGLGDANLGGQGPHILAKMEWYSLHLCIKFNDRNFTATATARLSLQALDKITVDCIKNILLVFSPDGTHIIR